MNHRHHYDLQPENEVEPDQKAVVQAKAANKPWKESSGMLPLSTPYHYAIQQQQPQLTKSKPVPPTLIQPQQGRQSGQNPRLPSQQQPVQTTKTKSTPQEKQAEYRQQQLQQQQMLSAFKEEQKKREALEQAYQLELRRDLQAQQAELTRDQSTDRAIELKHRQADLARWEEEMKRDAKWLKLEKEQLAREMQKQAQAPRKTPPTLSSSGPTAGPVTGTKVDSQKGSKTGSFSETPSSTQQASAYGSLPTITTGSTADTSIRSAKGPLPASETRPSTSYSEDTSGTFSSPTTGSPYGSKSGTTATTSASIRPSMQPGTTEDTKKSTTKASSETSGPSIELLAHISSQKQQKTQADIRYAPSKMRYQSETQTSPEVSQKTRDYQPYQDPYSKPQAKQQSKDQPDVSSFDDLQQSSFDDLQQSETDEKQTEDFAETSESLQDETSELIEPPQAQEERQKGTQKSESRASQPLPKTIQQPRPPTPTPASSSQPQPSQQPIKKPLPSPVYQLAPSQQPTQQHPEGPPHPTFTQARFTQAPMNPYLPAGDLTYLPSQYDSPSSPTLYTEAQRAWTPAPVAPPNPHWFSPAYAPAPPTNPTPPYFGAGYDRHQADEQAQARMLGIVPPPTLYNTRPYSEMGFPAPPVYNPYLAKLRRKAYFKQQKLIMKYGQAMRPLPPPYLDDFSQFVPAAIPYLNLETTSAEDNSVPAAIPFLNLETTSAEDNSRGGGQQANNYNLPPGLHRRTQGREEHALPMYQGWEEFRAVGGDNGDAGARLLGLRKPLGAFVDETKTGNVFPHAQRIDSGEEVAVLEWQMDGGDQQASPPLYQQQQLAMPLTTARGFESPQTAVSPSLQQAPLPLMAAMAPVPQVPQMTPQPFLSPPLTSTPMRSTQPRSPMMAAKPQPELTIPGPSQQEPKLMSQPQGRPKESQPIRKEQKQIKYDDHQEDYLDDYEDSYGDDYGDYDDEEDDLDYNQDQLADDEYSDEDDSFDSQEEDGDLSDYADTDSSDQESDYAEEEEDTDESSDDQYQLDSPSRKKEKSPLQRYLRKTTPAGQRRTKKKREERRAREDHERRGSQKTRRDHELRRQREEQEQRDREDHTRGDKYESKRSRELRQKREEQEQREREERARVEKEHREREREARERRDKEEREKAIERHEQRERDLRDEEERLQQAREDQEHMKTERELEHRRKMKALRRSRHRRNVADRDQQKGDESQGDDSNVGLQTKLKLDELADTDVDIQKALNKSDRESAKNYIAPTAEPRYFEDDRLRQLNESSNNPHPITSSQNDWLAGYDEDELPVYPHEASIIVDVRNGYQIYYDPLYEPAQDYSHYDRMYLGDKSHQAQNSILYHSIREPEGKQNQGSDGILKPSMAGYPLLQEDLTFEISPRYDVKDHQSFSKRAQSALQAHRKVPLHDTSQPFYDTPRSFYDVPVHHSAPVHGHAAQTTYELPLDHAAAISHHSVGPYRDEEHHRVWHPPPQGKHPYFARVPPRTRHLKRDPPGVPLRRETTVRPFEPRAAARNETPMYVRPYLEDPVWLQPDDDEMGMLHEMQLTKESEKEGDKTTDKSEGWHPVQHHYHHDLPGDPDLENPYHGETDYEGDFEEQIIDSRNNILGNETPMYVRPYLEDPVWLQPDDDEIAMLYDIQLAKETEHGGKRTHGSHHRSHHYFHDLPGDPDLEDIDDEEADSEDSGEDEDEYLN